MYKLYLYFIPDKISNNKNGFRFSRVALSFNGGKDCTVLFHLVRAVVSHMEMSLRDLASIYFPQADEFPVLLDFMREGEQRFFFFFAS